jgi:hypothetical protein
MKRVKRAMLVYQAGIANVFEVTSFNLCDYGRDAKRLLQSDFHTCIAFSRGMAKAGAIVRTAYCNQAGDIVNSKWYEDFDNAPFHSEFCFLNEN